MSAARDEVLRRVRAALADRPAAAEPGEPGGRPAPLQGAALLDRFAERVADYRATVTRAPGGDAAVAEAVAGACARHAVRTLAVPDGLPDAWVPGDVERLDLAAAAAPEVRALDRVDGVLTTCAHAIAETGTLVLDGGPGQGPRAATLVPDLHICVVPTAAVVPGVPEAIAALRPAIAEGRRPVTFVSGPSATSDIELDRVEGVHGPRRLEVVLAG